MLTLDCESLTTLDPRLPGSGEVVRGHQSVDKYSSGLLFAYTPPARCPLIEALNATGSVLSSQTGTTPGEPSAQHPRRTVLK